LASVSVAAFWRRKEEGYRAAFFVIGTTLSPLVSGYGAGGGGMYGKETLRLT
jgi:hypothetical protein